MACFFGRFRSKQSKGFDLTKENLSEVPTGFESSGSIRLLSTPQLNSLILKPEPPSILKQNGNNSLKHERTSSQNDLQAPKTKKPTPDTLNRQQSDQSNGTHQNTVTSYPPLSNRNSVASFVHVEDQHMPVIEITTPEVEHPRPSCRKFTIDFVPEPLPKTMDSASQLQRGFSIDESLSNASFTSNNEINNDRSPSLVVPNIRDIFKMKNRINSVEDGFESSAESDDGYLTLTKGSSITEMISPPIQKNARKEGIMSDTVDKTNITIEVFEKDQETIALIKQAILDNDFLNNMMDTERLQAVINAMSSRSLAAGINLITEGETGSHFYVSEEGSYDVVKEGRVIKTFGKGVVFGELAVLYKAKRFASVKVTEPGKVWMLERKIFQKIMMSTGRKEQQENVNFLKSVPIFSDLPMELLEKISDLLIREFFSQGSRIIQQGDPGDKFYIIRGGNVDVVKQDEFGNEKLIGNLSRGQYFGEQALLNRDKRLASIIACPPGTECLTLDRVAFENYLGAVKGIRETKLIPEPQITAAVKTPRIRSEYEHIKLKDLKYIGMLGVGGYGRVELVQHRNQETFALKYLKKYEMVQQQQQKHVFNEKEIMLACDTPFIVKLYRTFRDSKYLYLLMEPCLGGDVWTILHQKRCFDERTTRFMSACVVEAFEYLHTRNIFYRDLKPENLMLDSRGYIKLVDFGFAKFLKPNEKTWTFAGTPEYVAPEIITNKGHNRAVDYWALGIFIFELLVGKPPFRGRDHMKTYNFILRGIDVVQFPQKIPKKAQALIKRLCRQNPTERLGYQKNGISDIKNHVFFSTFEWEKLKNQTLPAPLVLPVLSNKDLSNFEAQDPFYDDPPSENSGWDIGF
ncbi:cGMP-dependent protein kinase 1-like [Culicoides brevitarsis]|uniref:cGMP-dependent protein kinase 1-like n=1 Tax=Culicoides brevitarsis TaxID=469753 RepID=UPI00307B9721